MQRVIDLNCDMGESPGCCSPAHDEALLELVTSASVACGFHAGDPHVMRRTVAAAEVRGVQVGAHPGLPDLSGFGRRRMAVTAEELYDLCLFQIGALRAFVEAAGRHLQHVKPHGALVEMALEDESLAAAMYRATRDAGANLIWLAPAGRLVEGARHSGLRAAGEFYADRAYQPDGRLVSRKLPGAVLQDPELVQARVRQTICCGTVTTIDGAVIPLDFQSICVHSDTPDAAEILQAVRAACRESGAAVKPLQEALR